MRYDVNYIKPKLIWVNILFFGITSGLALFVLPVYIWKVGLTGVDWAIFITMAVLSMMATTMGYHRLFAHRAFKAHPVLIFLNLFFGAAAFGGSVIKWASQHRDHHRFTDTDHDPYNIKRGFWYAHMDWFLRWDHKYDMSNVNDLAKNRLIRHQHEHYIAWSIFSGIALPIIIGACFGSMWGAALFGVCGRLFLIHQSIFFINSACHTFGTPTYDKDGTAKDSWFCAILTHGEGYHSFHHRFPSDFRNGIRWYHWDPTKWLVSITSWFGLTWDLTRAPEHQILAARSETEHVLSLQRITATQHPKFKLASDALSMQYEQLKARLKRWEVLSQEYRRLKRTETAEIIKKASLQMARAREDFFEMRKQWLHAIERNLLLVNLA